MDLTDSKTMVPRESKLARDFLPGKQSGPMREKTSQGMTNRTFTICPGKMLHMDPMPRTVNTSGTISQMGRESPERDKREQSLRAMVICWNVLHTLRALSFRVFTRIYLYNERILIEIRFSVNETFDRIAFVQYRFYEHCCPPKC